MKAESPSERVNVLICPSCPSLFRPPRAASAGMASGWAGRGEGADEPERRAGGQPRSHGTPWSLVIPSAAGLAWVQGPNEDSRVLAAVSRGSNTCTFKYVALLLQPVKSLRRIRAEGGGLLATAPHRAWSGKGGPPGASEHGPGRSWASSLAQVSSGRARLRCCPAGSTQTCTPFPPPRPGSQAPIHHLGFAL